MIGRGVSKNILKFFSSSLHIIFQTKLITYINKRILEWSSHMEKQMKSLLKPIKHNSVSHICVYSVWPSTGTVWMALSCVYIVQLELQWLVIALTMEEEGRSLAFSSSDLHVCAFKAAVCALFWAGIQASELCSLEVRFLRNINGFPHEATCQQSVCGA